MILAGKKANKLNIPVVLDPVGVGASTLRNKTAEEILSQIKIDVLRGNLSEISYLAGLEVFTKGVDTAKADEENDTVDIAKSVANQYACIVGITGRVDVISDGIKENTIPKFVGVGIDGIAVASAIISQTDIKIAAQGLKAMFNEKI